MALLFYLLRLKMERKREDSSFIQREEEEEEKKKKTTTILPNSSISLPGMIVIIVLINSISNFGVISFLP